MIVAASAPPIEVQRGEDRAPPLFSLDDHAPCGTGFPVRRIEDDGLPADSLGAGLPTPPQSATGGLPSPSDVPLEEHAPSELSLPFVEWLDTQAAWFRREHDTASELIVDCLDGLIRVARSHEARSVTELLSWTLSHANLAEIPIPPERPESGLAELVDAEARWYLALDSEGGRLIAWALEELADRCTDYGAHTVRDFREAEAAAQAAEWQAFVDSCADDVVLNWEVP